MVNSKISLFSFLLSLSVTTVQSKGYTEKENFILADCGIGFGEHPGDSTSREVIYYSGDVWNSDGSTNRPTMMANVPWDGSYPWRKDGLFVNMPNGDRLNVVVDPQFPDPSIAGLAATTYSTVAFTCYSYHRERVYQLDDGKWCSSAYICNHRPTPTGDNTPPPPGPAPAPPHEGTETTFSVNADTVSIYNGNLKNILGKVNEVKQQGSRDCVETAIDIGDSCTISFVCHGAGKSSNDAMADVLLNQVANSPDFSRYDEVVSQVCYKYDQTPGNEGQCIAWKDKVDKYLIMPKTIGIAIDNIPGEGSSDNPSVQAWMRYTVNCPKVDWSCQLCKTVAAGLNLISASTLTWGGQGAAVNAICAAAC
ncbi:hypothetical protein K402DRAFT_388783 [Aulographum hederae CBS 113979]|uniref:Uncharacterized protein n=1 Tax=Aulographum hederae CBS 113979 TaxID=1176131 RepID=A0A6G1HDS3_9PEZI|nr:hypothetical protein K402DRAFT_388783 [Aulographum hederae CBS 113979]